MAQPGIAQGVSRKEGASPGASASARTPKIYAHTPLLRGGPVLVGLSPLTHGCVLGSCTEIKGLQHRADNV